MSGFAGECQHPGCLSPAIPASITASWFCDRHRCKATKKSGGRCSLFASAYPWCHLHYVEDDPIEEVLDEYRRGRPVLMIMRPRPPTASKERFYSTEWSR